jgi:hypothetical protein
MRKKTVFAVSVFIAAVVVIAAFAVFRTADAQRTASTRFEYAVINGSYAPYPPDGPTVVTAAVNICYMQNTGCRNEEVKSEVIISKFLQDERIENNASARNLVQQRAIETSFAKAISRLGTEGWEMIDRPSIEFDLYYTNPQGIQTVKEGNRTERQHIWFKRARQ